MFGYITINKPELKIKEYNRYHSYYCGLCRELKEKYGFLGQMTLTYDMTFLILLLTSLYEPKDEHSEHHCIVHPVKKHAMLVNEVTQYAADMNIILAYHNLKDDWEDEKKIKAFVGAAALKGKYEKIEQKYPRQCKVIDKSLKQLAQYELSNEKNLDLVSGCFGNLMAELFLYRQDVWEDTLREFGFFLGKFIYLLDAYLDVEEDIKTKSYNPLKWIKEDENYEEFCKEMLVMMIAETSTRFERLPCVQDGEILRNILYGGVWNEYNKKQNKDQNKDLNGKEKVEKNDGSI